MKFIVKRGLELLLAGILSFNGMAFAKPSGAMVKDKEDILSHVAAIPKENEIIDYNNLDFMIPKEKDLEYLVEKKEDVYNAYVSPSRRLGKNILREPINWQGKEINEKLSVYCNKGFEEVLDAVSGIAKKAVEEYEKAYGHKLEKEVRIYVYNSYRYGQTSLVYVGTPTSVGGFFHLPKRNIIVPWRDNRFVNHVVRHELSHAYLTGRIFKEYLKAWKILYNDSFFEKPLVMPLWLIEGDAERRSEGLSKEAKEIVRDLVLHNGMKMVDKFPEGSFVMYKGAQDFFVYLDDKYGEEKSQDLWDNYYDIFRDLEKTEEFEDIFGNIVEKEKVVVNPLLGPLFNGKTILNYSFKKTYGKNLDELSTEWLNDRGNLYFKEQDKYSSLEDFAVRVCPEKLSIFPAFNGNSFAYLTRNKSKTRFEIKLIKNKFENDADEKKNHYDIQTISEGTRNVTRLKVIEDSRMDMNKDYLVLSALVDDSDRLLFCDLTTGKLESKKFKNIIEINDPAISSDNRYVAFSGISKNNGYSDIYVYDRETEELKRLTNDIYFEKDFDFKDNSYDVVFSSDKTCDGNYDLFMIKDLSRIERIVSGESDDVNPRFTPSGKIAFISDRKGIDNIFLLDNESNSLYQVTNLISPVKDIFVSNTKEGEEKFLITYFENLSYNIADLDMEKINLVSVGKRELKEDQSWSYAKGELKNKEFKRRWGWPENLAFGVSNNGLFAALHFSDGIREKHFLSSFFIDFKKIKNSDFSVIYGDFSKKVPYLVEANRFVYSSSDNDMKISKGAIRFNYPLNINERLSNRISVTHSSHDSKDFFEDEWQKFYMFEERYPEYWKGVRVDNVLSFTKDHLIYGYKGPVEGYGCNLNLRTKINPSASNGLEKITSFAVDAALGKYIKLGGFGVFGARVAAGFGHGKEFEEFGIGNLRTLRGYGRGAMGQIPEFYGKGYYLLNLEISRIPLVKAIIPFWNMAHHGLDASIYLDMGNVFDDFDKIAGPKASMGFGLTSYFLNIPLEFYFSFPFEKGRGRRQFSMGYHF